jgi:2-oxoglutarate dehydrogenase E1 component
VLPVLIHGDSAVAGQGVNQEMLNFAQTRGYGTGGTVHIVVNNQIGFHHLDPRDYRSGHYCTDIFKMADAPIFHVNGDDPEAVALVTQLAIEFRQEFKKDVVVDIVCFRKLGHNEQDEPMVTQPLMYKKISKHPGTRKLYADKLVAEGVLPADGPDQMIRVPRASRQGRLLYNPVLAGYKHSNGHRLDAVPDKKPYIETCDTTVPMKELQAPVRATDHVPGISRCIHRVKKIIDDRAAMGEGKLPVDWGMGENLAYASLLVSGYGVRISGEDVGRGTFFHRHAAFHDQNREKLGRGHLPSAEEPAGKAGRLPVLRLGAVRRSRARLRVRLRHGQPVRTGGLGRPVRRLRQWRPGRDRPVHRLRRSQVGPCAAVWSCCCRTATKGRVRSTRRPASSATCKLVPR